MRTVFRLREESQKKESQKEVAKKVEKIVARLKTSAVKSKRVKSQE